MKFGILVTVIALASVSHLTQTIAAESSASESIEKPIVKVGVLGPLTTKSNIFGLSHLQGITHAINEFNANATNRLQIQMLIGDDQHDPEIGVLEARRMVDAGAVAILGPANSSVAKRVVEEILIREKINIPIIASLATATELTTNRDARSDYFFRANVADKVLLQMMLGEILGSTDFHAKRLVILYEGEKDVFGEGLARDVKIILEQEYKNHGNPLFRSHEKELSEKRAHEIIDRLVAGGYTRPGDAYLLLSLGFDSFALIKAIRARQEIQSTIFAIQVDHSTIKQAAEMGVNVEGVRVFSAYYPENAKSNPALNGFEDKFRHRPNEAAALAYDATILLLEAIRSISRARSETGDTLSDYRARLRDKLNTLRLKEKMFLTSGTHFFSKGEYESLDFHSYRFQYNGELRPTREALAPRPVSESLRSSVLPVPVSWILITLYCCGAFGSFVREIHVLPAQEKTFGGIRRKFTINKYQLVFLSIIDPIIAFTAFATIYLGILFSGVGKTTIENTPDLVYLLASVTGILTGFYGIPSLKKIIDTVKVPGF